MKVDGGRIVAGGKALTPQFMQIQSFDVSLDRREVVFSAKRKDKFDIGLVSLDGSDVHWFPLDAADAVDVQWAPRGNKVSYIVRAESGDVVRTVHVPTSMSLTVFFPYATVRALAWNPAATRYGVVVTSPDASERIESMDYSGENAQMVVPSAVRLDVSEQPFAGALLMRPKTMHYGERLPLVVWVSPDGWVWNDARGKLIRDAQVACAVVRQPPDAKFWSAVESLEWIDPRREFTVGADGNRGISIVPGDVPGYRVEGKEVVVARPDVESFAASWIPQQLKGRHGVR